VKAAQSSAAQCLVPGQRSAGLMMTGPGWRSFTAAGFGGKYPGDYDAELSLMARITRDVGAGWVTSLCFGGNGPVIGGFEHASSARRGRRRRTRLLQGPFTADDFHGLHS